MATAPSLTRTARAAGIITRHEVTPVDDRPGFFNVRDTATGSGALHLTSANSCTCKDHIFGTGVCKHRQAVQAEERELAQYATQWDFSAALQRPRCPLCGSALEERSYYVGGVGYRYVQVCSDDASHSNRRPRLEDLPEC